MLVSLTYDGPGGGAAALCSPSRLAFSDITHMFVLAEKVSKADTKDVRNLQDRLSIAENKLEREWTQKLDDTCTFSHAKQAWWDYQMHVFPVLVIEHLLMSSIPGRISFFVLCWSMYRLSFEELVPSRWKHVVKCPLAYFLQRL